MTTDHNEAMRLTEACKHGWLENVDPDKCSLDDLLSLLRQQAERIAELQSAHAIAVEIAAQYAAERDQLREEVGRLSKTDAEILACNYPDGEENGPTISAPDYELISFARQLGIHPRNEHRRGLQADHVCTGSADLMRFGLFVKLDADVKKA